MEQQKTNAAYSQVLFPPRSVKGPFICILHMEYFHTLRLQFLLLYCSFSYKYLVSFSSHTSPILPYLSSCLKIVSPSVKPRVVRNSRGFSHCICGDDGGHTCSFFKWTIFLSLLKLPELPERRDSYCFKSWKLSSFKELTFPHQTTVWGVCKVI